MSAFGSVSIHVAVTTYISNIFFSLSSSPFHRKPIAMSFFKRKAQSEIPPVEQKGPAPSSPAPSYRSTPSNYDNNSSYNQQPPYNQQSSYNQQPSSGGYNSSRGGASDPNRSELFSGYNAESAGPNRFTAGDRRPELREPAPGEENEEDVEGIKQQIRATKQESVNSTRNALRLAREAEETARGTLLRLGDQSGTFLRPPSDRHFLIV